MTSAHRHDRGWPQRTPAAQVHRASLRAGVLTILYGWFYSGGELFRAGTLHTGHWKSWKKSDGTYGAKYTSAWNY